MDAVQGASDWFRVVNALGSLAVLVLLFVRIVRVWRDYSLGQKMIFASLVLYNIGLVVRSIEIIFKYNIGFSYSLPFFFAANTTMLIYLAEPRRSYAHRMGQDPRFP